MIGLRRALIALAIAGVAGTAATVAVIATSDHATLRGAQAGVGAFVCLSFMGTGLFAWWRRPENRFGALMTAVGFAFLLAGLTATDSPALFAITISVGALYAAIVVHMLLVYPEGRLRSSFERLVVATGYFVATLGQLPGMLFLDTRDLTDCSGCPRNLLLISDNQDLGYALLAIDQVIAVGVLAATIAIIVRRLRVATPPQRRMLAPVLWSGGTMVLVLGLQLAGNVAGASSGVADGLSVVAALAFASIPYAFLGVLVRSWMSRASAVEELVGRLSVAPGRLRDALAEALGDPSLAVAYWLPESERYVDADGRAVTLPAPGSRRMATEVEHDGRRVAAIIHDDTVADEVRAAGAAAALALENERLEAELRARLEDLRASRSRAFEAALAERRRLERDLHDGAQQRLVALSLQLQLARTRLPADPDATARLLDAANEELRHALEELRELARGIHPAILTDRGLHAALEALAARAPLPVEITATPQERLPAPVEAAAYFVVAESLTNVARYARADRATVAVQRLNASARVEIRDDGVGGANPARGTGLTGLADRLAAMDGRLEIESDLGQGTLVRAEIPCA